jgi:hypothetical protein
MKFHALTPLFIFLIAKTSFTSAQASKQTCKLNPSVWDEYPWKGQGGLKLLLGSHNHLFCEVAYMKSDLPKLNSRKRARDYDYLFGNQNIFAGLEITKTYNDFLIAPKFGYELNLVLLSARISSVNYYSFQRNNLDARILLEPGLTLFGFVGVHYGYSIPLSKTENLAIGRHRISASVNYFDMWRRKFSGKK